MGSKPDVWPLLLVFPSSLRLEVRRFVVEKAMFFCPFSVDRDMKKKAPAVNFRFGFPMHS